MTKRIRIIISALLTVTLIFGVITVAPLSASAAKVGSEKVSANAIKTRDEAVSWLRAQGGASYNIDTSTEGTQCVEFVKVYVNWLMTGNPWQDVWNRPTLNGWQIWQNSIWSELGWSVYYNSADFMPQPGDIFSSGTTAYGHTGVVISSDLNTAVIADANADSPYNGTPVKIHTVTWRSASSNAAYGATHFIRPNFASPGNNPQGVLDGVSGGAGTINVSGWAFDRDNLGAPLEIHVYIGGQSGNSNAEGHNGIIANQGRGDVNAAYGCGDYHGFSATISTNKRGQQTVYVYALNIGSGDNVLIGSGTINILSSQQPQITYTYTSEITKDAFRVCAVVDNPIDVREVRVATWTQSDQSDLHWNNCHYNGYGTYFIDLSRSDFASSQIYINHVYLYDYSGNSSSTAINMVYDLPQLEDIRVSKVSENGFCVSCKMDSQFGISSAQMAVWTETNGQDDLVWHTASVSDNYVSCYINASEHKNELNRYIVHLYVGDKIGQSIAFSGILPYINLSNECFEISSVNSQNNKYTLFNRDFSWTEAKEWCESQGGHLVTIQDETEWNTVKTLLSQNGAYPVWLGAESTSGTWKWVTGETMGFSDWEESQPDNANGLEHYLGTHNYDRNYDCYKWNDYLNSGTRVGGFICEFDDYYTYGDVNFDGKIDINDVTAIQRHLAGIESFNEDRLIVADTNGDGEVTVADATRLQKYIAKYQVTLG